MKRNDLVFVRNYNLRSSFDLLHLRSIEYLANRLRWRRPPIQYFDVNVGIQRRSMVWVHAKRRRKLASAIYAGKYWKRGCSVMSRLWKINPKSRRAVLVQARAGAVSTGEYYDFFLSRSYRNRRPRGRLDLSIPLDEFLVLFEQYDLVPRFSVTSHELPININFDSLLIFWPPSFIYIALQSARYPFWVHGGDYSPFRSFSSFAQVTTHSLDPEPLEPPDYLFGYRARVSQKLLLDVETRLQFFVVILCWGFLFDFRGPRMLESQFAVGFLSAVMLSACLRADKYVDKSYASDDWVGENNEETSDTAPVTNWITRRYGTYLYTRDELRRMWDEFSVNFWKLRSLNFPIKHSRLFSNDLARLVRLMKGRVLLNLFPRERFFKSALRFTEIELRFFSYNNYTRPLVVFLRLIPKIICVFDVYAQFYLRSFLIFITRVFTINSSSGGVVYNFIYNCVYSCYDYIVALLYLLRQSNVVFCFRAFLIFFVEVAGLANLFRHYRSFKPGYLVLRSIVFLFLVIFFYLLFKSLTLFYLILVSFFVIFAVFIAFRLDDDNARADKFSFFERGFKLVNVVYLWLSKVDLLYLGKLLVRPFLALMTYLLAAFTLLSPLTGRLYKNSWWGYLRVILNGLRPIQLSRRPPVFILIFERNVGIFEYLCFWLRRNFIKVNSYFRLGTILGLVNLVELNWLIVSCVHLFYGAAGWWVTVRSSEFVSQKWREVFDFNNIRNSSGALSGSFFTAFGVRSLWNLKSFSAVFLEVLFFRLAIPFSNISSKIKNKILGWDLADFTVMLNDLFTNTLFLDSWGVFRRTHFSLNDVVVVDTSFLNVRNFLNYILRTVLLGGIIRHSFRMCVLVLAKFCTSVWYTFLLLVYSALYITIIIFMVYLVILTATLLYICGIKAGLSIFLYISLKIIVICLILSVMREKE